MIHCQKTLYIQNFISLYHKNRKKVSFASFLGLKTNFFIYFSEFFWIF